MKALAALALLVACGHKETPPAAGDAAARPIDAAIRDAVEIDAPQAAAKPTVKKLVAAGASTCAVMSDKTVRCWGANGFGQLGDGGQTDAATPVTPKLRGIEDIAFGAAHACALLDDGSIACWGKIGVGKKQIAAGPTAVPGVTNAMRVFGQGAAGCATVADDSLVCWGDITAKGRIRADGGAIEFRGPTPVVGLDHVIALGANGALRDDGGVYYIGGDGEPVRTAIANAAEIASTGSTLCARLASGVVQCVGGKPLCASAVEAAKPEAKPMKAVPKQPAKPVKGKKPSKAPKTVTKPAAKPAVKPEKHDLVLETLKLPAARHLAFSVDGICVVTATGKLQCLDGGNACKADAPWPELAKLDLVSDHCARSTEGAVKCWTGDGKKRVVTTIAGAAGSSLLAAGTAHACAIVEDRIGCWGKNDHGQLGRGAVDGEAHPEAAPVKLP
ncbi:MAG: regulator of chromosome condensation [Myxococcales bacterium]|nr:regulator of chromosome condensation [Myxococcales bacterium]